MVVSRRLRYLIVRVGASDSATTDEGPSGLIAVSAVAPPNYDVTSLTPAAPITVSPGGTISQTVTFDNIGAGNGTASLYWEVYLDINGNSTIDALGLPAVCGHRGGHEHGRRRHHPPGGRHVARTAGTYRLIARLAAADDCSRQQPGGQRRHHRAGPRLRHRHAR